MRCAQKNLLACHFGHACHTALNYTLPWKYILLLYSSTALERTLAPQTREVRNLFRHSVGLLWRSDQPVARAFTYTGQYNTTQNGDEHPCLELDSNSLSQRLSEQSLRLRPRGHWGQRTTFYFSQIRT
jgi:hypothetical protein